MGATGCILVFLNVLYIVGGLGCLLLGILGITEVLEDVPNVAGRAVWYMIYHLPGVDPDDVFDDDIDEYDVGYVVLLVSGVVLLLMGFAGAIGTIQKNSCLLKTAWFVLTLVLIIELVVALAFPIYAWVQTKQDCDSTGKKYDVLVEYVQKYNKSEHFLIDFDDVQEKYECCGVRNRTDWVLAAGEEARSAVDILKYIPESCCRKREDDTTPCQIKDIYEKTCDEDIDDWLQDEVYLNLVICLAIGIVLAFILIISLVLTCLVLRKFDISKKY